jgi:eukaryotic-like serine/threonine-protein kinase
MTVPGKLGRYEIVREVGRGAMGVVYEAVDPTIGRKVALKAIRFDGVGTTADEAARRFKNEARAAGGLNHPNIVTVYDAGEDDGTLYLAMEFIEGSTLEALLRLQRTLSAKQAIDFVRQIASGLDFAHSRGIVHRDIKPGNIMLAAHGLIKITDFGIARAGEAMTITGQVVGTPNYMSPEQVLGKSLDGRSDLFSVGVMLYEMITGERPFEGQSITTIMYKIVHETPIPPRKLDSSIHPGLSAVIEKSLAKSAEERFSSGADLTRALDSYSSAPITTTSTLGQPTGEYPSVLDANTTHDAAPSTRPATLPSSAVAPAPTKPTSLPERIWSELSPRRRRQLIALIILGMALFLRSQWRKSEEPHSNPGNADSAAAVPAPPAPQQPAAANTGGNDAASAAPANALPLVRRENATSSKDSAVLKVNSSPPSAEVEIDGKSTGKTTPTEIQLARGQHSVSVRMEGFQPATLKLRVKGGEELEYSPALTVAIPNIGIPAAAIPDLSRLKDLSKEAAQGQFWQQWAANQGSLAGPKLVINSSPPGATILVDGKDTGKTSPAVIPMKPGRYHVRLALEDYQPMEKDLTVTTRKPALWNPTLKPSDSEQP